ncbi:hypothetical protein CsSME_00003369 [Camellia sinensis var. sinensis]
MTRTNDNEIIASKSTESQSLSPTQVTIHTLVTEHYTQGLSKELKPKKIKRFYKNISLLMLSRYIFTSNKALFY